ncbi:MAG: PSD1 and planctomycete cytochrome C domain-containing protein [Opitutaceae bacterium]
MTPLRAAEAVDRNEQFVQNVLPILQQRCFECHSHESKIKAGLALDSRAGWELGGDTGPAVRAGDPKASLLIQAIRYDDADLQMPPKGRLPENEIRVLESWVRDGAFDPRRALTTGKKGGIDFAEGAKRWAFQPVRRVEPPTTRNQAWPRTDLDRFVLAKLEAHSLAPAEDADRRVLIRRLWFALLGLPPSPEDVRKFLSDPRPDAVERLVDQALGSVHFGERWARHWMDVVHYSETHGLERDSLLPFAWRYRDYLVRAFNDDVPFDQMLREHVAGDLISPRWRNGINEAPIGTGFWRFVEFFQTPVDVKREEVAVIDSQIDTFSRGFQAMSMSCARCHDHKFDPIAEDDFYALYGILRSSRVAMHVLEPVSTFTRENSALERIKSGAPALLADHWNTQFDKWPQRLHDAAEFIAAHPAALEKERPVYDQLPVDPWRRAFALAVWAKKDVLFRTFLPLVKACDEDEFGTLWRQLAGEIGATDKTRPEAAQVFADFRNGMPAGWRVSGAGLPERTQDAGNFALASTGEQGVRAVRPAGYFSDTLSDRHGGMLRSPDFTIETDCISILAGGHQGARARLVIENFQGDSTLFAGINPTLEASNLQWFTWRMRDQWRGRRAYVELFTRDDRPYVEIAPLREVFEVTDGRSGFGVVEVVFHPGSWKPTLDLLPPAFWQGEVRSWREIGERLAAASRDALLAWKAGTASEPQLVLLCEVTSLGLLDSRFDRTTPALAELIERYRHLADRIPIATRAPGLRDDGNGLDSELFPRGNHLKPGRVVPRRYLQVLGSSVSTYHNAGSGRLALAHEVVDPSNPLTSRVMVNRVWHWLFSQGLVQSVDNFGQLGALPSNPELLDFLAAEWVNDGWSLKRLIRRMVLSRTWQLSSDPSVASLERDPGNQWLQRASLRRLEAEEIRDALLVVAGNFNPEVGGRPVRNHYRVSVDTSQPPSGPLDGHGRRSLYLEMRRNARSEFLRVFDQPSPAVTTGGRSLSNVPAQSLALLNDPFILEQARVWAERILRKESTDAGRFNRMFEEAFARPPDASDLARLQPLLLSASSPLEGWTAVAHVLFNHKEFLYLP